MCFMNADPDPGKSLQNFLKSNKLWFLKIKSHSNNFTPTSLLIKLNVSDKFSILKGQCQEIFDARFFFH
jgi:hypothetical protein